MKPCGFEKYGIIEGLKSWRIRKNTGKQNSPRENERIPENPRKFQRTQ